MAKSLAQRLNFVYYSKISIKLNKPSSKPSKPASGAKSFKPASYDFPAWLACLIASLSRAAAMSSFAMPINVKISDETDIAKIPDDYDQKNGVLRVVSIGDIDANM